MNSPTIPRMPEIPLEEFDADYRQAEIEHRTELETMLPELEIAAELLPADDCDFFRGGSRTVLDIGCGTGTLPFLLAQKNSNATVIGVDFSEDSIAYAKEFYAPRAANLSYHVGSVEDLSQMFQGVDMITCVGALHHFPDLDSAIQQIMGTLNDNGAFLLSDLNRENIRAYFSDKELKYLHSVRQLPEKVRNKKLRRQGYTTGKKMRRFLTLMSYQAAYTPEEVSRVLGTRYGFKGRMASQNYLLAIYKL